MGGLEQFEQFRTFAIKSHCEELLYFCSEIHFFESGLPLPFEVSAPQASAFQFEFSTSGSPNTIVTCWAERIYRDFISEQGVWAINIDGEVRASVFSGLNEIKKCYKEEMQILKTNEHSLENDKITEQQLLYQRHKNRQLQLFSLVVHQSTDILLKDTIPKFLATPEGQTLLKQFENKLPNFSPDPNSKVNPSSPLKQRREFDRNFLRSAHRIYVPDFQVATENSPS